MRRTLCGALLGAALVAVLGACQPTGDPRCDQHADAVAVADQLGYVIDCTPPASYPLGWADHEHRTLFVHADRLSSDGALVKVMWHETAHGWVEVHHKNFPTQQDEERWADGFSYCHSPQLGVGYLWRPTPAECHTLLG